MVKKDNLPNQLSIAAVLLSYLMINFTLPRSFPGIEWDESVYACIIDGVRNSLGFTHVTDLSNVGEFYAWHPPFYFWIAGFIGKLAPNVDALYLARVINTLSMTATLAIIGLGAHYIGKLNIKCVIPALLLPMVDMWIMMSARIGWFENVQFIFVALAQIAFISVIYSAKAKNVVIAGVFAGIAVVFKHIGAWMFVQVALLFVLFPLRRKQFIQIFLLMVLFVILYGCIQWFRGGDDFIRQQAHHLFRVLGTVPSPSVNFSFQQALLIFLAAYGVFWPSILTTIIACAAAGILFLVVLHLVYRRDLARAISHNRRLVTVIVLSTWLLASVIGLGAIKLRNPHYYFIVFLPASIFLGCAVGAFMASDRYRKVAWGVMLLLVIGNVVGYGFRLQWNEGAFDRFYTQFNDKFAGEIILTEEPLACLAGNIAGFRDFRLSDNLNPKLLNDKDIGKVIMLESRSYVPAVNPGWQQALLKNYEMIYSDSDWKWNIKIWSPKAEQSK